MRLQYGLILLLIVLSVPVLSQNKKKATHKPAVIVHAVKADSTGATKQFTDVDEMPTPIKTAMPEYPESAKKANIQGTVWVNILVSAEGKVKEVNVLKMNDGSPEIKQAALDAAKKCTFKPAMKNNKPVEMWATVPFRFRLQK
jgi:protein TonB